MNKYIFLFLIFVGCNLSNLKGDQPSGEIVQVMGNDDTQGELIAITDSSLVLFSQAKFMEINKTGISKIQLANVKKGAKNIIGILNILFYGMASSSAFKNSETGYGLLFLAGGSLSVYALTVNNPDSRFTFPETQADIDKLKKHCRYPLGLKREQLEKLLIHNNQGNVHKIY